MDVNIREKVPAVKAHNILLFMIFFLSLHMAVFPNNDEENTKWYNVKLNGAKVGYYSCEYVMVPKENQIKTLKLEKMNLRLRRMDTGFLVNSVLEQEFAKDGNLLRIEANMSEGNVKRIIIGLFDYEKKKAYITTDIDGSRQTDEIAIVADAISDLQLEKKMQNSSFKIGEYFAYNSFLIEAGKYCRCTLTLAAIEDTVVMDGNKTLYKWIREVEGLEQKDFVWTDQGFSPWIIEQVTGKNLFRIERTFKKNALSLREVLDNTFDLARQAALKLKISPGIVLDLTLTTDRVRKIIYKIRNAPSYHMLNGGGQKIILEKDGVIVLEVYTDIADFIKEGTGSGENLNLEPYLKPNLYIQSGDKKIKDTANLLIYTIDERKTVLNIREWINRNIKWCSDYGFSTAVSTIEAGAGDCTEFAVLTAALCRSAGIPARIAMGYILTERSPGEIILSPHMWVEARLYKTWYPIDATGNPGKMNPFKIRFLSSSLNNDEISKFFDLYSGIADIDVELSSIVEKRIASIKKQINKKRRLNK
jgi:predicted transglutaminase-like cysteine proteinase